MTTVFVKAVKPYKARNDTELSFKKGQIVSLRERDLDSRLFHGETVLDLAGKGEAGSVGWFPFDAVKIVSADTQAILNNPNRGMKKQAKSKEKEAKSNKKDGLSGAAAPNKAKLFGAELETALLSGNGKFVLPIFLKNLMTHVRSFRREEGLFRLSGGSEEIASLKDFWESNFSNEEACRSFNFGQVEIHSVTGMFKLFLRQLPNPLIPYGMYAAFLAVGTKESEETEDLLRLYSAIPDANYTLLIPLMDLLVDVSECSAENLMIPSNLGIVFGPTLMRSQNPDPIAAMLDNQALVSVVAQTITHWFSLRSSLVSARGLPSTALTSSTGLVVDSNADLQMCCICDQFEEKTKMRQLGKSTFKHMDCKMRCRSCHIEIPHGISMILKKGLPYHRDCNDGIGGQQASPSAAPAASRPPPLARQPSSGSVPIPKRPGLVVTPSMVPASVAFPPGSSRSLGSGPSAKSQLDRGPPVSPRMISTAGTSGQPGSPKAQFRAPTAAVAPNFANSQLPARRDSKPPAVVPRPGTGSGLASPAPGRAPPTQAQPPAPPPARVPTQAQPFSRPQVPQVPSRPSLGPPTHVRTSSAPIAIGRPAIAIPEAGLLDEARSPPVAETSESRTSASSTEAEVGAEPVQIELIAAEDDLGGLPEGWEVAFDGKGRKFFIDHINERTSWEDPRLF